MRQLAMIVAVTTPLLLGGCLPMMGMMLMGGHDNNHDKPHDVPKEQGKGSEKSRPDTPPSGEEQPANAPSTATQH